MNTKQLLLAFFLTLAGLSSVHATSFVEWQMAQFSPAELLDPAVSGADANPAGDGLSNWLKYVFDLDPHAACIEGAPAPQMVGGTLALNFFRRTDYPYLIYALEASPDLRHWSWRNSYQPSAVTSLGAVAQWTVADPYQWPAGVSQFLRLRVEAGIPGTLYYYPPEDLTARKVSVPFGLELRWSDRSNAEVGYRVERQRVDDGVWGLFAITGQDTFSYFDHTVLSGVTYLYRVQATFPGGVVSPWTVSGSVNPGGGPGGPGGPGSPGGGNPDPDPDSDSDSFKDSVDAYPHDKRRSRDLPTLTYAEIDISTAIIGEKDVTMIALDDDNQVAFSYHEEASGSTLESLKVVVWKDGAQVGNTHTYPLRADNSNNPAWEIIPLFLNAAGTIAGTAIERRLAPPSNPPVVPPLYASKSRAFTQSAGGARVFLHGRWGAHSSDPCSVGVWGLTSTGIVWGEQRNYLMGRRQTPQEDSFNFFGSTTIPFLADPARQPGQNGPEDRGADWGPKFAPRLVNKNQQAIGTKFDVTDSVRYLGGEPQALPAKAIIALGDDGKVFGVDSAALPDPGLPPDALRPFRCAIADGQKTDLTTLLPVEFRKQIAFDETTGAQINSAGDILFTTLTLEGPEDAPEWVYKPILWTSQTSTANPNGTLAIVLNPAGHLNEDRLMVTISQVQPPAAEGQPAGAPYMAAKLLVPFAVNIDADNTTVESYPQPSKGDLRTGERAAQNSDDEENYPGVRVYENLIDVDADGVVGYADGIDKFENGQANSCWKFEPMLIAIPPPESFPNAKFVFKYSSSDPDQMTREGSGVTASYILPQGKIIRLWKKDGDEVRKPQSAHQDGDFIRGDQEYTPQQLGWQQGDATIRLYIEVVDTDTFDQSTPIDVEFYPVGQNHPETVAKERIKVRPYYMDRENPGPNDEYP